MITANQTINGTFGTIYLDGVELSQFNECEVTLTRNYENILIPGTRRIGHKLISTEGRGTMRGYRVTMELAQALNIPENDPDPEFTLEFQLADPDNGLVQIVTISGVKFSKNDIMRFRAGEIVTEDWEFVFDGDIVINEA